MSEINRSAKSQYQAVSTTDPTTIITVPDGQTFFLTDVEFGSSAGNADVTIKIGTTTVARLLSLQGLGRHVNLRAPWRGPAGGDVTVTLGSAIATHITIGGYFV